MNKKQSTHIKIISGFYYLFAVLFSVMGIAYVFASGWIKNTFINNTYIQNMGTSEFVVWGFVLLFIAGLEAFLAFKIYKSSKIARIVAMIISGLGFVWAIFGLVYYRGFENIFFFIIHGYFLWVLKYKFNQGEKYENYNNRQK